MKGVGFLLAIGCFFIFSGCSSKTDIQKPEFSDTIIIQKENLYTITLPNSMKFLTEPDDIANLFPSGSVLNKNAQMVDIISPDITGTMFLIHNQDMSKELAKSGINKTRTDDINGMIKSMIKMNYFDSVSGKLYNVDLYKNKRSCKGIIAFIKGTNTKINGMLFTTNKKGRILCVIYRSDTTPEETKKSFFNIIDTMDTSDKGIKDAKAEIDKRALALKEYEQKLAATDRDGLLTGVLNGFTSPFKFVINFFRDNKFSYISKSHTKVTYWIGFILGFLPGLMIVYGFFNRDR